MTPKIITVAALLWLAACSPNSAAPLVATAVEVTPPRPGVPMQAAYLKLRNNTETPIRITSAASPDFERVELHETVVEDGIARMRRVDQVIIEPQAEIAFERGGLHLMLMRPTGQSASGARIRLDFFDGDRLLISVSAGQAER